MSSRQNDYLVDAEKARACLTRVLKHFEKGETLDKMMDGEKRWGPAKSRKLSEIDAGSQG
jgi:hypothetical protein